MNVLLELLQAILQWGALVLALKGARSVLCCKMSTTITNVPGIALGSALPVARHTMSGHLGLDDLLPASTQKAATQYLLLSEWMRSRSTSHGLSLGCEKHNGHKCGPTLRGHKGSIQHLST